MKDIFSSIKEKISKTFKEPDEDIRYSEEGEEDYLEIDTAHDIGTKTKIIVRPFVIEDFADVKPTLDALREGYTIALVNIKQLKDRDIIELKRVINKIKKTCDAIDGDIAGFGEDWIVVTPSFASVYRNIQTADVEES